MRKWTEAAFAAALAGTDCGRDGTVWLPSRKGESHRSRAARLLRRRCERAARGVTLVGLGCVASAAIPGAALAPIGPAHASIETFAPALHVAEATEPLAILSEAAPPASEPAAASFEEQRQEVEDYLRFGSRNVPRRIVETIVRAANATGVDPVYLMALADTESSFRPEAKAPTSTAEGLFQFVERTWLEMVRTRGAAHGLAAEAASIAVENGKPVIADEAVRTSVLALRRDPYLAALLASEMLKQDAATIGFRIGRKLNRTEMYLAHFLGLDEAARFLELRARKKPPSAAKMFPAAARANIGIFFAKGKRGKLRGLSVTQVYDKFDRLIGARADLYKGVQLAEAGDRI